MSWRVSLVVFCGLLISVLTVRVVQDGTDGTGTWDFTSVPRVSSATSCSGSASVVA